MESSAQSEEKEQKPQQTTKQQAKPAIAPGQMRVIKRNGSVVSYDAEKIAIAITKAFLAVASLSRHKICEKDIGSIFENICLK